MPERTRRSIVLSMWVRFAALVIAALAMVLGPDRDHSLVVLAWWCVCTAMLAWLHLERRGAIDPVSHATMIRGTLMAGTSILLLLVRFEIRLDQAPWTRDVLESIVILHGFAAIATGVAVRRVNTD